MFYIQESKNKIIFSDEQKQRIFTADVFMGEEALQLNLIDGLYTYLSDEEILKNFNKEKGLQVVNYTEANYFSRKYT